MPPVTDRGSLSVIQEAGRGCDSSLLLVRGRGMQSVIMKYRMYLLAIKALERELGEDHFVHL